MLSTLINILEFVSIIICLVFSTVLWVIPIPQKKFLIPYRNSVKILSLSYLLIAIISALYLYFNLADRPSEILDFPTILVSSLHAILFTVTIIKLLNPFYNTRRTVQLSLIPMLIMCGCYFTFITIRGNTEVYNIADVISNIDKPDVVIRIAFFLFYFAQLIYYIAIFINERKRYLIGVKNYFSDTNTLNLKWVEKAYYSLLIVAFAALIFQVFPNRMFNLFFTAFLNFFYLLFALNYLNYLKVFNIIEPYIEKTSGKPGLSQPIIYKRNNWENYKKTIIEEKYYTIQGVTLDNIAQKLLIGRTTLSSLINSEEGVSFSTWINTLRINLAKTIILNHPEYTISQIAELTGYTEVSNFSRQFKLIVNKSPSIWKKSNFKISA